MTKNYFYPKPWQILLYCCLFMVIFYQSTFAQPVLPAGFSRVQVASGLVQTTAMETLPDGRILVCEQPGRLRVIKNGALLSTPAVTLTNVDFADEKGLIGVVADPNFTTNKFIYLYYTVKEGAERANGFNRIIRYTLTSDVVDAASRTIIYDLSNLVIGTRYHSGGSMIFGKDGMLYVGTGENQQGSAFSQSLENTHGKILRMTPTGGIPTGNPFTGSGARSRIWAYGLRNAFTFDIDKITGKIYVNDVGGGLREELNDATTAGRNFGWAEHEGPCTSGCTGYTNPIYHYFRENETTNQTYRTDQGCAITGGVFFNTPSNYPSIYQGKYFFLDFCNNWINYIDPANPGAGKKEFAKMMGWHNVYLKAGADGNLYYLCRGPGRVNSNSIVYKIVFSGGTAPTITQEPSNATVAQGDNAQFCVVASGSPTLTYQWKKDGVNISGATSACYTISNVQPTHAGTYSCVVTNSQGSDTSIGATLTVTAPNSKPVANIITPPTNSTYRYGDVFNYSGDATDTEDGTLPASAFTWDLVLHHNTHTHNDANLPDGVKTGSFTANNNHIDGDVYYELFLTVTDSKGAQGMDSIRVNPITSNLTLQTIPAGLNIRFDLQPRPTPFTAPVVSNTPVPLEAISPQTVNGVTYIFDSWSNGSTSASTTITATDNAATYTANFKVAPTPVLLTPTHDAYVRNGIHAGTAHGATDPTNLIIKRALAAQVDNSRETYLKFDMNSLAGAPSVVQLRLYGRIEDATVTNLPVEVFSVANTTWAESTITWNNKPASSTAALRSTVVTDATARYYTWDVTNYVKAEFAAGRKIVSFAFKAASEHNPRTMWSSKETGTNPPQLSIIAEPAGNTPPSVAITSPTNGSSFTAPATITINANASDIDGTITKVEFFNGATKLGEDVSSPYSFTWSNVPIGSYQLTARATDNDTTSTTSAIVNVTVQNNVPPTVTLTSPANGASFTAPACITINANASDSDGTIVKVEFFNETTKLGEDLTSPYSFTWCNVPVGSYSIHVVATDNTGATAISATHSVTVTSPPPGLPIPWVNGDIGAVAAAGNATFASGTFTIEGSGADIWSTADEFHYVRQPFSGDVELITRVTGIENTNAWAKAGLMIRESTATGAINAAVFVSSVNGVTFQRRTATGGTSVSTVAAGIAAPVWLKLTRSGNNFTASYSTSGTTWTAIGTAAVTMTASTQVGLAVTSHADGTLATGTFTNVTVTGPTAPCEPAIASADDGNVAANVLDNDMLTRWSASGDPQWIQFCLSSLSSVSGVQIAFYKGNERRSIFDILVSTDGTNFTTVASGLQSSGTSLALENFPFTPRNAKYVRIVGHGNSVNLWNSYTEVEITASAAAADALTTEEVFFSDKDALVSFPNPVSSLATIKYKVEEPGRVTLSIMDSDSNNTTILVDKQMNAGTYQMIYDTKNLSRGVHLIKLVRKGKFTTYKLLKQ